MILYHGTSSRYLPEILEYGLQPREYTDVAGNWEGNIQSKPDLVYLTDAYALYYALAATKEHEKLVVIQVDVPEEELLPDEDFLAYVQAQQDGIPLKQVYEQGTPDPVVNRELWKQSLEYNGVVSMFDVPLLDILDVRTLNTTDHMEYIMCGGGDSMPIPMNYRICGAYYRDCLEQLFKHPQGTKLARPDRMSFMNKLGNWEPVT